MYSVLSSASVKSEMKNPVGFQTVFHSSLQTDLHSLGEGGLSSTVVMAPLFCIQPSTDVMAARITVIVRCQGAG